MAGPVDAFIFNGPCYLTYGANTLFTNVTIKMNHLNNDGGTTIYTINSEKFTEVEGVCFGVTVQPHFGKPIYCPVKSILQVGPNAWGILQPLDGGLGGIKLALTENGKDIEAKFAAPDPSPPGQVASQVPSTHTVQIQEGSINNGMSDESFVGATYQLPDGSVIKTPVVPPGKQMGPAVSASLTSFQIVMPTALVVDWYPNEDVEMDPLMSVVVIGESSKPSLAYSLPLSPWKYVELTIVRPG